MLKRICSLILAISIILGAGLHVAASVSSSDVATGSTAAMNVYAGSYDLSRVSPGTTLYFPLTADMFTWSSGGTGTVGDPVTASQLRNVSVVYSSNSGGSSAIGKVTIDNTTYNGFATKAVKIVFADDYMGVNDSNFSVDLYLTFNRTRDTISYINLSGTLGITVVEAYASDIYVSLAGGKVLLPREYINSLEIGAGGGLILKSKVYPDRRYYAKAVEGFTSEDSRLQRTYPSQLLTAYTLNTVGLTGAQVMVEGYDGCFVYNGSGDYLGETGEWLPYATKYYVTSKRINMGGSTSSSSSSSSTSSRPSSTTSSSSSSVAAGTTVNSTTMTNMIKTAINAARSSGSSTATISLKDVKSVTSDAYNNMIKTAAASNLNAKIVTDTMNGKTIMGRITLLPSRTATSSGDIGLGVYTDSKSTGSVQSTFERWYRNKVRVISLSHKGSFGMSVGIAAKVDLKNINTKNIYLYSYDSKNNSYTRIEKSGYYIDGNGYFQFNTTLGGDIIISEGALERK